MDPHLRVQLEVCEAIGSFLGERDFITDIDRRRADVPGAGEGTLLLGVSSQVGVDISTGPTIDA